ncbi:Wzz/FepE/Etk N-terminal domain-containing protein [Arthrobacter sp. zg-Y859]|uniref:Wzz/FepE/Etk N-terminal domain-containing protein n=1 Tax=Arthrobacter jinronghuae TaxID=2964609 RepID=A0ABT1NTT0_9MICC|nr:Wzz/FepE/Etk N-terminal domain-containing protein [Arthrobacter jinronghuae]MCQ1951060.1 Wzz/FepE/Etk N-terminal domain-containing protein [Arthrobacter jinronghuae]UWX79512.1 Wzz/FepE/Etk N-terminal domain-containing protein [Arthrobacter jinronghuae]
MGKNSFVSVIELRVIVGVIMRRWLLIVTMALLFGAAGLVLGAAVPVTYSAGASLTVAPLTTSPFASSAPQQVNMATEREVMASREVAQTAAESLDDVTVDELMEQTSVAAPTGSQVLKVSVRDADARTAADRANALAQAYLDFRRAGAGEIAAGQIELLNQQVAELTSADSLSEAERDELSALHEQLTELSLVGEIPGRVISSAAVPTAPASPGVMVYTTAGVALGLLVGCTLALAGARSSRRSTSGERGKRHSDSLTADVRDGGRAAGAHRTGSDRPAGPADNPGREATGNRVQV